MADLSSYLNFNVTLDKSGVTPVIILEDISAYPSGVQTQITGVFSVTQPDSITVTGSFTPTPDVSYQGGALISESKELRLASDNNFQKGTYTILYTVRHPDYDETHLTKSFILDYNQATLKLAQDFDLLQPSLKIYDQTNYILAGFATPTLGRAWNAVVQGLGVINGSGDMFDLQYNGQYYNSKYAVTLTSIVTYTLSNYSWVEIQDKIKTTANFTTFALKTLTEIYTELTAYQSKLPACGCGCEGTETPEKYVYAFSLFQHLIMKVKSGDTLTIKSMIDSIYCILRNGVTPIYNVDNQAIEAYTGTFPGNAVDQFDVLTPLSIVTQPSNVTKNEGDSATFTVAVSGGVVPYAYQWEISTDSGGSWSNISGATAATYIKVGLASGNNGNMVRAKITDFVGTTLTSSFASITMNTTSTIEVIYGYSAANPFVDQVHDIIPSNSGTISIAHNANISINFSAAAPDNYIVIKEPAGEIQKTAFNNGTNTLVGGLIPTSGSDEFLAPYVYNGYRYYVSRNPLGFLYTQPLNLIS